MSEEKREISKEQVQSHENQVIPVKPEWAKNAHVTKESYEKDYAESINDPEAYWGRIAKAKLDWMKPWTKVKNTSFKSPVSIKWFEGAKLNVSVNCLDRHLDKRGDQPALIWEADDPKTPSKTFTYRQLSEETNRTANVLKSLGVRKGDRVTIYMPMIPEAAIAMLACTRIGAVHSVIFGGFSPDSIADRVENCESTFIITADEGRRAGKSIAMKANVDKALTKCAGVKTVLVYKSTGGKIAMTPDRDVWFHDEAGKVDATCEPEVMDAEDPLFLLYTSGSTGKPKGVLHTTAGYLLFVAHTHETVFDYRDGEIYWCTADVGWVTGHSYIVYGPLANGATTVMFEGVPTYPDSKRFWQIIDKHKVNSFYTSPTAIRALMREGDRSVQGTSRRSLRVLGSVGEPINPEAWRWYYNKVGDARCPIVDTWWQTETGGILITSLPGATIEKPGSATKPFFGVKPVIVDDKGQEQKGTASGNLCLADSWPGQMRTVYGDHDRFEKTYFSTYPGLYFSGDGCRRDKDGDYWITGRVDDVINVSGHRLGTAEIESALVKNPHVAEAAVVGYPHQIKGQGIYAFVTLKTGVEPTDALKKELTQWVRNEISPIAQPDLLQWAPALPKTRSGKIMRRILRKIAEDTPDSLGDTTTLADPGVVELLVNERLNKSHR
jgi:acetyl-CoA synthetase